MEKGRTGEATLSKRVCEREYCTTVSAANTDPIYV
jgi:hypothetical protein